MSFFAEDCVYEDVALGALNRGKSEVRAFVQATLAAISDFTIEPKSVFATVDRLASEWTMTGTQTGDFPGVPATGKSFSVPVASIMEFQTERSVGTLTIGISHLFYSRWERWPNIAFERDAAKARRPSTLRVCRAWHVTTQV